MPWVFLGCPASLTYLPQMTSLPPVSPLTQVMDVVACVLCESDMCVRCWACEEDVGRGSVQLSDHSPTRREEDPYLAPEEKKRRLTNLEAMAETRRQQLLDNCVETIDLTTANYQPTFRTASSNQTRGPHLPLQRPPCVSHLPAVWAAAASRTEAPEAGLSAERIIEFLKSLGCTRWCIGRELHADGGLHFHVFAERRSRFDTENPRYFDIGPFHPNIASVKKLPGLLSTYARMADTYLEEVSASLERAATSGIDAPTSMLGQTSTDSCLSLIRAGQSLSLAVGCLARMVAPLNSDI